MQLRRLLQSHPYFLQFQSMVKEKNDNMIDVTVCGFWQIFLEDTQSRLMEGY